MKLLDTATYEDYGKEWYLQILSHYPRFTLLDLEWQWDEFPATELFPLLLISIGPRSLFGFTFRFKHFECRLDLLTSCPRNLQSYKRRYYSENYDD